MEDSTDPLKLLGIDMCIQIFMHLDDTFDVVRLCLVSHSWRQFVIANALCKKLCLRMFPEMSGIAHVIEEKNLIEPLKTKCKDPTEWKYMERNHKVYALLAHCLNPVMCDDCISSAYRASSTDNEPQESIQNTLLPGDRIDQVASYWSSKGASDPNVPEALVYKLKTDLCVITEIQLQPFQAYFQDGFPIYSVNAVKFHMGHPKRPLEAIPFMDESDADYEFFEQNFVWTYSSPELPMIQENSLQKFKLPEPVLCIGGILKVELLGRVQRQEMDGLYYVCVSHVQAVGRPLSKSLDVRVIPHSGECAMSYLGDRGDGLSEVGGEGSTPSRLRLLTGRLVQEGARGFEHMILSAVLGNAIYGDDDSDDEPVS